MPLSKTKQAEYMRQYRVRHTVIPKSQSLSLPVFGTVKSRYWAKQFFDNLGITQA